MNKGEFKKGNPKQTNMYIKKKCCFPDPNLSVVNVGREFL